MKHFKVKTWRISDPTGITTSDCVWLQSNNIEFQSNSNVDPVTFDYQGRQYQYAGNQIPVLKCITDNDKKEIMLQLKFGDRLILESWSNYYEN